MSSEELQTLYNDLWTRLGAPSQILKLKEELLELLVAIREWEKTKCEGEEELANICDEMADVTFCIDSFKSQMDVYDVIDFCYDAKAKRTRKRLEEGYYSE